MFNTKYEYYNFQLSLLPPRGLEMIKWFMKVKCDIGASLCVYKKSNDAKIRNRYNQVPHLTQDTKEKVTNSQLDTTNKCQDVSPFPAGDHKAHINRRLQRHSKHKTEKNIKDPQRSTAFERSVKYFTGGLKSVKRRQPHP